MCGLPIGGMGGGSGGTGGATTGTGGGVGGGGTSGGTTTPTTPTAGINGGGFARGAITGFGSIFVNGVEFSTSSATITVEDSPGQESQLRVGQVVLVQGTINDDGRTGTARSVSFNDDVQGAIQSVSASAGTFVVLGQTVKVTPTTAFDDSISPASIDGLRAGLVVEVSGLPDANGVIVATRVEAKAAGGESEVTGKVSALDATARRFSLNALTVDYSGATVANGTLANGACVEAKGTSGAGGTLTASRVELKSCTLATAANDKGELEGFVTRFGSATDFDVGNQRVATSATTTWVNGVPADLRANVEVEVEGSFNASGTLDARKVKFELSSDQRLLGTVDALNAASSSFTMFGVTVTTDAATRIEDKSAARATPFRYADIRTGDYLEVRGFRGATAGTIVATLVERRDLDTRREVQGTAGNVAQPGFTVLGVAVTTSGSTSFRNSDGTSMNAAAFFAALPGRLVKARGSWNGTNLSATEAELQNP